MLQATLDNTTLKKGALAPARYSQLVATATASTIQVSIARGAVTPTDRRCLASHAVTRTHTNFPISLAHFSEKATMLLDWQISRRSLL
jgi:hypothetical protein